jgi:hypothetical protein
VRLLSSQQQQSMARGQGDYSILNLGGQKVPNAGFNNQQGQLRRSPHHSSHKNAHL